MGLVQHVEAGRGGMVELGPRDAAVEIAVGRHDRVRDRQQPEARRAAGKAAGHGHAAAPHAAAMPPAARSARHRAAAAATAAEARAAAEGGHFRQDLGFVAGHLGRSDLAVMVGIERGEPAAEIGEELGVAQRAVAIRIGAHEPDGDRQRPIGRGAERLAGRADEQGRPQRDPLRPRPEAPRRPARCAGGGEQGGTEQGQKDADSHDDLLRTAIGGARAMLLECGGSAPILSRAVAKRLCGRGGRRYPGAMAAALELGFVFGTLALAAAGFFAGIWIAAAASRLGGFWRGDPEPSATPPCRPCWTEEIESDRRYRHARAECINEELVELEARLVWERPNALGGGG
jgi:hypothetical protein